MKMNEKVPLYKSILDVETGTVYDSDGNATHLESNRMVQFLVAWHLRGPLAGRAAIADEMRRIEGDVRPIDNHRHFPKEASEDLVSTLQARARRMGLIPPKAEPMGMWILRVIMSGKATTYNGAAELLGISPKGAKTAVCGVKQSVFARLEKDTKTRPRNKTEAIRMLLERGELSLDDEK